MPEHEMRSSASCYFRLLLLLIMLGAGVKSSNAQTIDNTVHAQRPNMVIIMADDLGYRDLSCYGCIDFETPNIDELARRGVRCTDSYVSHPYCSPSRAGLLTGQYQQSFGHESNPPYDEANTRIGIDTDTRLLPSLLQDAGYQTGLLGKWHLGAGPPFRPAVRGFSHFYGFLGGGHDYFNTKPNGKNYNSPIWRDHEPTTAKLTYLTDDLTTAAERFIETHRDHPFCLLLMYNAPHAPDQVTDEYMRRVNSIKHPGRRKYAALVQGVDEGVKRITQKLDSLQLTKSTLVVFLSDNGGRRAVSDNRPLRGNKGWLHEGGIRVPLILSMPGTLPEGEVYRQPVLAIDLLPTAMRLANLNIPERCDGVDLFPFLMSDKTEPPHASLFWRVSGGEGYAIRSGHWKLVHDIGMAQPALYDLATDVGENHDLSNTQPRVLAELERKYLAWHKTRQTPRWQDAHIKNTRSERKVSEQAGTRQFPMPWINSGTARPANQK
ncbi:MAG: sulfatase-like hydrolase/transferase [Pirellulaceae bacterium]|nr:sulfatase-like hydrolase/transferase [Pirellulaceae bacterium]